MQWIHHIQRIDNKKIWLLKQNPNLNNHHEIQTYFKFNSHSFCIWNLHSSVRMGG